MWSPLTILKADPIELLDGETPSIRALRPTYLDALREALEEGQAEAEAQAKE